MKRRIIEIDQEKCNGCGACADACHEGAIAMVDGKAMLMRDDYCDGLGDCLPACPAEAITFVEREAAAYDEKAVMENKKRKQQEGVTQGFGCPSSRPSSIGHAEGGCPSSRPSSIGHAEGGCPSSRPSSIEHAEGGCPSSRPSSIGHAQGGCLEPVYTEAVSRLAQWPVQIKLAPINAPYFNGAKLLIAADCTAYAYAAFHERFMRNHITLVGCPKLDDVDYSEKLTEIIRENDIKSVTLVRMEVPCCGGLEYAAKTALQQSGKFIPWQVVTISIDGRILD